MSDEQNAQAAAEAPKPSPFTPVTPAGDGAAAPRTVIIKRPTLRRPGEAPKPITLKPPMPGHPVVQPLSQTANIAKGIEISHADAAKKVTSRISVSSATAPIPPVVAAPATPAAPAAPATPLAAAAPAAPSPASEKKVTSRITLESAFSAPSEMPTVAQPRTIKLKRPGAATASAVQAATAPTPLPEGMTPIAQDGAEAENSEESITRRKTIKVKRPGGATLGGAPKLQLSQPPQEGGENLQSLASFGAFTKAPEVEEKVSPVFAVVAAVAALVGALLIWTLASQTYGERAAVGDYAFPKGPHISPPPGLTQFN